MCNYLCMTNLQAAVTEALHLDDTAADLVDDLARAAFGIWQYNGHDIPSALAHIYKNHIDGRVRGLAGEAYDLVLTTPIVWRAYEIDFAERLQADH